MYSRYMIVLHRVMMIIWHYVITYLLQGMYLGSLRWSLRGFFLTGCMACRARRIPHSKDDPTSWSFTINGKYIRAHRALITYCLSTVFSIF